MAVDKPTEYMDGWTAHKDGVVSGENPYNERTQPFSYRRWLSGWCNRYDAVKHWRVTDLDNEYD